MVKEKKKKSLVLKVIVTILIILIVLAIAIGIYVFSKVNSLSNAIHNPLDRDKSELRKNLLVMGIRYQSLFMVSMKMVNVSNKILGNELIRLS